MSGLGGYRARDMALLFGFGVLCCEDLELQIYLHLLGLGGLRLRI